MKFGRIQKIDYYLNTLLQCQKEKEMAAGKGAHLRVLDSTLHCFGQMMGALLSFFPCRPIADHAIAYLVYEARAWCTCNQLAPSEEILLLCDSVRLHSEPESLMRELENIG